MQGIGMDAGKDGTDHYLMECRRLLASMRHNGFLPQYAVPIDPDGELLGGAHRVSCALALEIAEIPVRDEMRRAWAPAWGEVWFIENGMKADDLARLRRDWQIISGEIQARLLSGFPA